MTSRAKRTDVAMPGGRRRRRRCYCGVNHIRIESVKETEREQECLFLCLGRRSTNYDSNLLSEDTKKMSLFSFLTVTVIIKNTVMKLISSMISDIFVSEINKETATHYRQAHSDNRGPHLCPSAIKVLVILHQRLFQSSSSPVSSGIFMPCFSLLLDLVFSFSFLDELKPIDADH